MYQPIDKAITLELHKPVRDIGNFLITTAIQKEQQKRQDAFRDEQRQMALGKYVAQELNMKHYATGTAQDPALNQMVKESLDKHSKMIQAQAGKQTPELLASLQNDVANITEFSNRVKAVNKSIEVQQKAMAKEPGVDATAWGNIARTNALFNIDPTTGIKKLKSASEIDPDQDYFSGVMQNHPELISRGGDESIRSYLGDEKIFTPKVIGDTKQYESKGVTTTKAYKAKLPPYMDFERDKDGFPINVQVRSEEVPGTTGPDGKPFRILDSDVYNSLVTKPATAASIEARFKQYNQGQKQPIPNGTEEAEIMKRHLALEMVQRNAVYEWTPTSKVLKNNLIDRQEMGLPNTRQSGGGSGAAATKATEKLQGSTIGTILGAMNGNASILEGGIPEKRGNKSYYDITGEVGALKLKKGSDGKYLESKVMVDPITNTMRIETPAAAEGEQAEVNEYQGKELRTFVKQNSAKLGIKTIGEADKVLGMHMDKDGNYTAKKDPAILQQASETRVQERLQAQQNKAQFQKAEPGVKQFMSTGDLGQLRGIIGLKLGNGGTIKDIKKRSWYKPGKPFYIEITDADGKITTVNFDNEYDAGNYIQSQMQND